MSDARDVIAKELAAYRQAMSHQDRANLILSALNSAGLKVLGREPTEAMISALGHGEASKWGRGVWFELFDAAPPKEK